MIYTLKIKQNTHRASLEKSIKWLTLVSRIEPQRHSGMNASIVMLIKLAVRKNVNVKFLIVMKYVGKAWEMNAK